MMTELDVVNDMLATMAEAPVTTLNIRHPMIAAGLQKLARASKSIQSTRWWFNYIKLTVTPEDTTYLIDDQLPCGTMQVWSTNPYKPVTWRDGVLLDVGSTEVIVDPTEIWVHFEVPFRDLPATANYAVAARAVYDFQKNYDADSTKTKELKDEWREKYALMNSEHIRTKKVNLLTRSTTLHNRQRVRGNRAYVNN